MAKQTPLAVLLLTTVNDILLPVTKASWEPNSMLDEILDSVPSSPLHSKETNTAAQPGRQVRDDL